ncbi:MAG: hypothetical protein COA58_02030 [Bacteroidetes bacterium]|nr:MAG: hypothetical protein COA58_02030 [Bacteroidota bacterium]
MNEASYRNLHTNREYLNRNFRVIDEVTDSVYLNPDELKKIYALDLSENLKLDRVRDLFIIGSYTGL